MLKISKKKSRKRKPGIKPTVKQEMEKIDLKVKKIAYKALVELVKTNPEVKNQLLEREFNIQIPERDPLKEAKEKIHETIVDEAIYVIEHNPKLVENLANGLIKNHASDLGIQTNDAPGTPFERVLQQIRQYREIKEGLGFKDSNSIGDTLKNPQIMMELLGLAGQVISTMRSDPKPPELIYVATVDGKDIKMTEKEYARFKQTGATDKVASESAPHTAGVASETAPKSIPSEVFNPGEGIRLLVYSTPPKVAQA